MERRIALYVSQGIPAATARLLATYELANQGSTSTTDINGKRVTA